MVERRLRGGRRWVLLALGGVAALLLVASVARGQGCTDSWTGAGDGSSWTDASNWDQNRVPNSGDTACINTPGSYTVTLSGNATVAGIEVGASSASTTQTLAIAANCNTATQLTAGGGSVTASGAIALTHVGGVPGNCNANSATLNMAGGATLTNAGTVLSDPADNPGARQITGNLANQGTVTINQSVGIDHLNNQAAGTVTLAQNQTLSVTSDSLSNAGTITIPAGAAINATQFTPTLTNTGAITATGDGHITAFGATFNAGPGSTLTGTLPLLLDSSTLNQQGGTISTVRVRANDNLSGDIPAGESVQITADCATATTLTAPASLTNHGTIALTHVGGVPGNCNANSATLNMAGGATLTNAGTVLSDPADNPGARQITGNLANQGTVTVLQQLDLSGNYTQSPAASLVAGAARLSAGGSATIDGDVSLNASPGPQSFVVLTAGGGLSGTFASANAVASASDGTYYMPTYSSTTAMLTLAAGSLSVSPSSGSRDTSVSVSGAGWPPSDSVTIAFGDAAGTITRETGILTDSNGSFATSITVPDRASAGGATIWLESRFTGGPANRMTPHAFDVNVGAPTITAVTPGSGPAAGGTSVTISGAELAGTTAVRFGQNAASRFSVDGNHQITATSPPGSGTVDVTVTTPSGTSATGAADRFAYMQPPAPTVTPGTVAATAPQKAGFAGAVDPQGSATVAHFEYGLDNRYRPPGPTGVIYDQATPDQPVGSGSSSVPVSSSASGLVPNALYHVRLVASSAAGTTRGPDQTFTTPADPAPPPPVTGQSEDVKPAGGTVFVLSNGKLVPLTENRQLPSGSVLDTRRGTVRLTAAAAGKREQTGTFTGAVFRFTQTGGRHALTTLTLLEGTFPGAPSFASCRAGRAAGSAHAALGSRVLQTLRSRASGHFRSRGRYAAGTVRGTRWTTTDRCDGTLIAVQLHSVLVTDFVKHVTVLVRAGHSYLARAG